MNVYDFDKTIYSKDCTADFYFWILKRQPQLIIYAPVQLYGFAGFYIFHAFDKTKMKSYFYSYLKSVRNIDENVKKYWETHIQYVNKWYEDTHQDDDLIISASALFMVKPACEMLHIKNVIASDVNQYTGEVLSKNCHGQQKVDRLLQEGYSLDYDSFYSDSLSDSPLASYAKHAYLVNGDKLSPWPGEKLK